MTYSQYRYRYNCDVWMRMTMPFKLMQYLWTRRHGGCLDKLTIALQIQQRWSIRRHGFTLLLKDVNRAPVLLWCTIQVNMAFFQCFTLNCYKSGNCTFNIVSYIYLCQSNLLICDIGRKFITFTSEKSSNSYKPSLGMKNHTITPFY